MGLSLGYLLKSFLLYQNTSNKCNKKKILILQLFFTGENFFNPKTKKWAKVKADDNKRSFNMYVLDPIYKMFDAIMNFKKEETDKLLDRLELKGKMKHEELAMEGNPRLNKS